MPCPADHLLALASKWSIPYLYWVSIKMWHPLASYLTSLCLVLLIYEMGNNNGSSGWLRGFDSMCVKAQ